MAYAVRFPAYPRHDSKTRVAYAVRHPSPAGLGLFGAVPILHGCFMNLNVWHVRVATLGDLVMGITYLVGMAG